MAEDKRIPELPAKTTLPSGALLPVYDPATDTTHKMTSAAIVDSGVAAYVGQKSSLETTEKDNIILAINEVRDLALAGPTGSSTVKWNSAPTVSISANTVGATSGTLEVAGVAKAVAANSFTFTAPSAGFFFPGILVVNYGASTVVFQEVHGSTLANGTSFNYPAVPVNCLLVSNFLMTSAGATQAATGVVKSVSVNGAAAVFPDAAGLLPLTVTGGNAASVTYTPSDTNNTTGFWAAMLGTGSTFVKLAVDKLATVIGTATLTTTAQNIKGAINELKAAMLSTSSDVTKQVFFPWEREFTISLDTFREIALKGKYVLTVDLPPQITAVSYSYKAATDSAYTDGKTLAEVNTWLSGTVVAATAWTVKIIPTTLAAGASGICHIRGTAKQL